MKTIFSISTLLIFLLSIGGVYANETTEGKLSQTLGVYIAYNQLLDHGKGDKFDTSRLPKIGGLGFGLTGDITFHPFFSLNGGGNIHFGSDDDFKSFWWVLNFALKVHPKPLSISPEIPARFQPYIIGGINYNSLSSEGEDDFEGGEIEFNTIGVVGGVGVNMLLSKVNIFAELTKQFVNLTGEYKYESAGIEIEVDEFEDYGIESLPLTFKMGVSYRFN